MPIEYDCPECRNRLRVPDEHAGQQAKCPTCSHVSIVPLFTSPPHDAAADHSTSEYVENPFEAPHLDSDRVPPVRDQRGEYGLGPHRGGWILTLGVMSLLCCNLLGIAAWLMANADLRLMDNGAMDPAGRGLTVAGKVLGIISLVIFGLMVALKVFVVVLVFF